LKHAPASDNKIIINCFIFHYCEIIYFAGMKFHDLTILGMFHWMHARASDNETRGPRGPWVAHLRRRSKVTVEPIIENPRGII